MILWCKTGDGKLVSLVDSEYLTVTPDKQSAMPAYKGTPEQLQLLLAYMRQLRGPGIGPLKQTQVAATQAEMDKIAHPRAGEWPTYNGTFDGNRYSILDQINSRILRSSGRSGCLPSHSPPGDDARSL